MNPSDVAPMVASVVLFIVVGVVILLRPISTRLGKYLEVLADEKRRQLDRQPVNRDDAARMMTLLQSVDQRLSQLEDRQDFTDKLLVERNKTSV